MCLEHLAIKERSRRYPAKKKKKIIDADYADDIALPVNAPTQGLHTHNQNSPLNKELTVLIGLFLENLSLCLTNE